MVVELYTQSQASPSVGPPVPRCETSQRATHALLVHQNIMAIGHNYIDYTEVFHLISSSWLWSPALPLHFQARKNHMEETDSTSARQQLNS